MLKMSNQSEKFVYQSHIKTFFWADTEFYFKHALDIIAWAEDYNCILPTTQQPWLWLQCPDDDTAMAFRLRWGSQQ
jgi:hypothetical protein